MLPSGNDAAMACAEFYGEKLHNFIANDKFRKPSLQTKKNRPFYYYFLDEMNESAKKKGLRYTNFTNPHGLSDVNNFSTSEEIAKISYFL